MPTDESISYLDLKGKLENLSKGIVKHAGDNGFPANLSAATVDEKVAMLAQKRQAFVDASSVTRQKSEEFNAAASECDTLFSKFSTQIYGLYGKQNLTVEDFGLKTWQKPSGRKAKENTKSAK